MPYLASLASWLPPGLLCLHLSVARIASETPDGQVLCACVGSELQSSCCESKDLSLEKFTQLSITKILNFYNILFLSL